MQTRVAEEGFLEKWIKRRPKGGQAKGEDGAVKKRFRADGKSQEKSGGVLLLANITCKLTL